MNKKNLLTIAFILLSITFISSVSFSQNETTKNSKKTPEEFASKMADRMKKNLSLSDDQYKQVYELALVKARDRIDNKAKYQSMDKESRKQLKKQNRTEFRNQLKTILTPEQIKKMEENFKNHKHNKGGKNKLKSE